MKLPRLILTCCLLAALIFAMATRSDAADLTGDFGRANQLYEQGRFAEAAKAHEKIISQGSQSAALWFNLGNARLKAGQTGLAITAYRQAQRLAPRDPDLRANLQFARNQAAGGVARTSSAPARWVQDLTVDEWSALASALFVTWCGLQAAGQWRPDFRSRLRGLKNSLGLLAGLLATTAAFAYHQQWIARTAVVIAPEAVVRRGPFEESQSAFTARDGTELQVTDERPGWWLVADASRRSGWIAAKQVVLDPPPSATPRP